MGINEYGRQEFHRLFGDWRSDLTTVLFGSVNKVAARQFQVRLEAILKTGGSVLAHGRYSMRRSSMGALWRMMKMHRRESQETTELAELDWLSRCKRRLYQYRI